MAVQFSIDNGMAKVVLDSPPYNILSQSIKEEITDVFNRMGTNSSVRVICFHTSGEHFCCGANLKEFPERIKRKTARDVWLQGHQMLTSILEAPQPTIAFIKGNALGGGAELASAFDIRIFAENAKIGYPEIQRGVFPGNGGLERLISLVGESLAMRLMLTGKPISADAAFQFGLASEVISESQDGLLYTEELGRYLSTLPGVALRTIKKAVKMYVQHPETFLEEGKELFFEVHETEDVREAVAAFLEKRIPRFTHQ